MVAVDEAARVVDGQQAMLDAREVKTADEIEALILREDPDALGLWRRGEVQRVSRWSEVRPLGTFVGPWGSSAPAAGTAAS